MENEIINNEAQNIPKKQSFWELVRFGFLALIIVVPIRFFIAEPFVVSGLSMFPTFDNGNYLIVDKISYRLSDPQKGDVVVFRYPNDTTKFFIKRIIGMPGETVEVNDDAVTIYNEAHPEGATPDQPYANFSGICPPQPKQKILVNLKMTLGADEYFVMGDNRECSSDSRYWGALKKNLITGKAFLRLWPLNKINILPGDYKQSN